jgi:hypothetical protein
LFCFCSAPYPPKSSCTTYAPFLLSFPSEIPPLHPNPKNKTDKRTPEESQWDEHLLNQEMDLKHYYKNKIEEIQKTRSPKFKVGEEVIDIAEVTIEEIIRPEDMRNTRNDGMFI